MLAHETGGPATSSGEGRYHDHAYRDAARALGLGVPEVPVAGLGYHETSLTDEVTAA